MALAKQFVRYVLTYLLYYFHFVLCSADVMSLTVKLIIPRMHSDVDLS